MFKKAISLILSVSLILTQPVFAQGVSELNIGKYLSQMPALNTDSFRPAHLRYVSYDIKADSFQLLLDKGDDFNQKTEKPKNGKTLEFPNSLTPKLQDATQELFNYFLIGLSLPNEKFWVNLRPDAPEQIIDPELEKTDMGKIMLEADLQLKKDTASWTSPQNPEGREYWDKLYKKAGELFETENITIPTITRPWIVPGEVIIREGEEEAYIYKANLKVMLEEDYQQYTFSDPRMKELNKYSTQLITELILPKLTQEINTAKKYAQLRQVFFSLILSRWFKDKYQGYSVGNGLEPFPTIDSGDLTNLTSKDPWSKDYYFNEYKKSFEQGEYNLKEQITTPTGQVIRSYVSGGIRPIPDNISSFVSAGTSSPIDWNLLIPIATTIAIAGGIYTMYLLQRGSIVASHQKESIKFMAMRYDIQYILKYYVDRKLLAQDDAVVVKKIFSDYKGFTLEETIAAVKYIVLLLKVSRQLSDETQRKAREKIIAILENSLQTIDKITGSSPLTPEKGASSAVGFFEGRGKIRQKMKKDINIILKKIVHMIPNNYNEIEQGLRRRMDVIRFSRDIDEILRTAGDAIEYSKKSMTGGAKEIEGVSQELNDIAKEIYIHMRNCYKEMFESFLGNYKNKKYLKGAFERVYKERPLGKIFSDIGYISDGKFRLRENKIISAGKFMRKILFATTIQFASSDYYYNSYERFKGALEEFKNVKTFIDQRNKAEASSSLTQDLPQNSNSPLTTGGIDFIRINYLTRPMGSFQGLDLRLPLLSKAELEGIDIKQELAALEQMINVRIDVSADRLKRLLAAMSQKDAFTSQRETQILPLLLRLCWLKEEKGIETTPEFRAVLLIADTGLFVEQGTS